jgi:hypothetical protein
MDKIILKRKTVEEKVNDLLTDVALLKVQVNKLENHIHSISLVKDVNGEYPDQFEVSKPECEL